MRYAMGLFAYLPQKEIDMSHSQEEPTTPLPIRDQLKADLIKAMKARDKIATATIRTMLGAIDNAEAVELPQGLVYAMDGSAEVPRRLLTEEDIRAILIREWEERRRAHANYQALGLVEETERVREEVAVFDRYLGDA
jgi:uncharacterized protein YqeY